MNSKIIATGSYVPPKIITNDDLATIMDTSHAWIHQRTGISQRRYEERSNANMCLQAALACDLDPESLDCIIVCTYTADNLIPSNASLLKNDLKISKNIPAFDLNAACSGFVYGLQVADALIKSGAYKRILLVGSDFNSRTLDFSDRGTAILFGDGAGAVVLEASEEAGIIKTVLNGADDREELIHYPSMSDHANPFIDRQAQASSYFSMKGSEVFKFAIKAMKESILSLVSKSELKDVTYILSHQANKRIIEFAAKTLKMDLDRFPMNLEHYGNTSAGSIPILLDDLVKAKKIKKGDRLILVAFGGGLTYGSSLIEWKV